MMAPRVDRSVVSSLPARWSSPDRSARIELETASDLERTPNPFGHPDAEFLSLFKGQGAAVRGDDRVVNVRHGEPPRRAISSAG